MRLLVLWCQGAQPFRITPAAPALNGEPPMRGPSVTGPAPALLAAAGALAQSAAERGERLSQRTLARRLRGEGHRFANQQLHQIALAARADRSKRTPAKHTGPGARRIADSARVR